MSFAPQSDSPEDPWFRRFDDLPPPWDDRPSLYRYVRDHRSPDTGGILDDAWRLPDHAEAPLEWAPGALEALFPATADDGVVEEALAVLEHLGRLIAEPTTDDAVAFYAAVTDRGSSFRYVDALVRAARDAGDVDPERLRGVALWLAEGAPDRRAVRLGIALLALCRRPEDLDLLLVLGAHDAFTRYAGVTIARTEPGPDPLLWRLARAVTRSGRVDALRLLTETRDPRIRDWILREGCHATHFEDAAALPAALGGGLLHALRDPAPDPGLITSAAEIVFFLLDPWADANVPSPPGMDHYPEGAEVARLLVGHLRDGPQDVRRLAALLELRDTLREGFHDVFPRYHEWEAVREPLLARIREILSRDGWDAALLRALDAPEDRILRIARKAAERLGLDLWEEHFQRLGPLQEPHWWGVATTDDPARMDRLIDAVPRHLPLDRIASGPRDLRPLVGVMNNRHEQQTREEKLLSIVLQELDRFPCRGWVLVRAGLRSGSLYNRMAALHALTAWDDGDWPADAEEVLREALRAEPVEHHAARIEEFLRSRTSGGGASEH